VLRLSEFHSDSPLLLIVVPISGSVCEFRLETAHQQFFESLCPSPQNQRSGLGKHCRLRSSRSFELVVDDLLGTRAFTATRLLVLKDCLRLQLRSCTQTTIVRCIRSSVAFAALCGASATTSTNTNVHPGQKGIDYVSKPRSNKVSSVVYNYRHWRTQ